MNEDNKEQQNDKPAASKDALLKQVRGEFNKASYQEVKNKVKGKLQEINNHEKAIKLLNAEIDKIWEDHENGF